MQVDELRRDLEARIASAPAPQASFDVIVRRGQRRRALRRFGATATGVVILVVVFAAIAVPRATRDDPNGTVATRRVPSVSVADSGWALHPKEVAGFENGTSLSAVATSARSFLVAGARPVGPDRSWQAAIWYSKTGNSWTRAQVPTTSGHVLAIDTKKDYALAIGSDGGGAVYFVWRSDDDGRRWVEIARGRNLFGEPAPEMGRPFVSGLRHTRGRWVATGGGSDGYAAVWVSDDGSEWEQVLDSANARPAGSIDVVTTKDGGLFGYWGAIGWYSSDGTTWSSPAELSVPEPYFLRTVAPGASTAFGGNVNRRDFTTPLVLSKDSGKTWSISPAFLARFPSASVRMVTRANGLWIAAGSSGTDHPDAWISTDLSDWHALPRSLRGAPGGTLNLIGAVRGRVVLLGTAPELDRYYTFDSRSDANPSAVADAVPAHLDRYVCTFGTDEALFGADGLPNIENAMTDRDHVAAVLEANRQQLLEAYPTATSVTIGVGFERAWDDGQTGGAYWIVPARDYAIVMHLASASDCPGGAPPIAVDGVPVFFTVSR